MPPIALILIFNTAFAIRPIFADRGVRVSGGDRPRITRPWPTHHSRRKRRLSSRAPDWKASMRKIPLFLLVLLLFFPSCVTNQAAPSAPPAPPSGSPVARYGQLEVVGTHICDSSGKPVALKGMSTAALRSGTAVSSTSPLSAPWPAIGRSTSFASLSTWPRAATPRSPP